MNDQSNKNNWIITQLNNICFTAVIMALGFLSFSAQAQLAQEPADFDRLLSAEFSARSQPTVSNCKTGVTNCAGVIYVQFSPEFTSASELVVRLEARAGQEPIGAVGTPGICRDAAGNVIPNGAGSALFCTTFGGTDYTPAVASVIDAATPANIFFNADVRVTYSKDIYSGSDTIRGTGGCVSVNEFASAQVSSNTPNEVDTSPSLGIVTYSYDSAFQGQSPTAITPENIIQYQEESYTSLIRLTCSISDVAQLWDMDYHVGMYRTLSQHVGANAQLSYIISPENSLEFFPLDNSNYITHAEITEDGLGVLIEYAQAVTDNTGTYQFTAADGTALTLTVSDPDSSTITWLNDKTVWLTLGSSIYEAAGVDTGNGIALDADRHVLVASTFPSDTSFGTNFAQTSTYRAVLTRHMSATDYSRSAPQITAITVAPGTESIDLTFSEAVCGSPETGCDLLTADHFEVLHYEGDILETGAPTRLTIVSVTTSTDNTAASLDIITLPPSFIDGDDYLIVRTARNSRFTDDFITDRTIFSATKVSRTIPTTADTYTEAESGMLHLQGEALTRAIPTIENTLAGNPSIPEGALGERSTATFTVTRAPTGYTSPTNVLVTITRTGSDDPTAFAVLVDGNPVTENSGVWESGIIFGDASNDATENSKTIDITFTGNDIANDNHVYTISIAPTAIPGGGSQLITFTIEDDDRALTLLPLDGRDIAERVIENDDGGEQELFVGVYPDATPADEIITAMGGIETEFRITEIVLNITSITDVVVKMPGDRFGFTIPPLNVNPFTFDGGAGVAIEDAENFLESLRFGINNDEPTGGPNDLDVNLELTITYDDITITPSDSDGDDTETTVRTITEENDPVNVVGLDDGDEFTVQVSELMGSGSIPVPGIENIIANDGGDDNGISIVTAPAVISVPTAADSNVMETLTLISGIRGELFTLSISQSTTELAGREDPPLEVILTFSDNRSPTASEETRTITINIIDRDIDLLDLDLIAIDNSATSETLVENDLDGQQYIEIYPDADRADILTEIGVPDNTFTITEIVLTITGGDGDAVVTDDGTDDGKIENGVAVDIGSVSFSVVENGNVFTISNSGGVAIEAAETFIKSLEFGINNNEPTGFPGGAIPAPSTPVTVVLAVTAIVAGTLEEADDTETANITINEENDPVKLADLDVRSCKGVSPDNLFAGPTPVDIGDVTVNDGGDDSGIARDNSGLGFVISQPTFSVPRADGTGMGTLTLTGTRVGETFTLNASSDVLLAEAENLMTELTFSDGRAPIDSNETPRTITICITSEGIIVLDPDSSDIAEMAVENDLDGQQFVGIYDDATLPADIIEEVGVSDDTFTITTIVLTITDGNGDAVVDAVVEHDNSFTQESGQPVNVFTFNTGGTNGVAIEDAETFIKSLRFGINSEEPAGGPDSSLDVTLALTIMAVSTVVGVEDAEDIGMADRTINEENDPVELVDLANGAEFKVFARDLVLRSTEVAPIVMMTGTVNDGGDGNGIVFGINPATFRLPTSANPDVMGTLTLSGNGLLTGEEFTLYGNSYNVEFGAADVMTTLTFSDRRGSIETRTITINIIDRGLALLPLDSSDIAEMAVEYDLNEQQVIEQQFIGIYSDATSSVDIIEEVGVTPGTFMVTQIKLNVTGSNGDVMVMYDDSSPITLEKEGNEFTYDGRVEVADAESFLKSLKFGINSDEPTGPVTLELTIAGSIAGSEGTKYTETAIRTIIESNDPVEVDLEEGERFQVFARDLVLLSTQVEAIVMTRAVNDGGDGNGVLFGINPATFRVPTSANPAVMGTLTLSGDGLLTGGAFTLYGNSDIAEFATADVVTILTFSDGRGSTVTRTITISIMENGLALLPLDPSPIAETAIENDGNGQQFIGIYSDATPSADIIEEVDVPEGTFMVTQIKLNVTGSNGDVMVMHDDSSPITLEKEGNEFTYDGRVEVVDAESFLKSLKFGIDSDEPTGPVTLELTIAGSEGTATATVMTTPETVIRTINESNDPVEVDLEEGERFPIFARDLVLLSNQVEAIVMTRAVNDGGDGNGVLFGINPATFRLPTSANPDVMGTLTLSGDGLLTGGAFTLYGNSYNVEFATADVVTTLTFSDGRGSTVTRTITISIMENGLALLPIDPSPIDETAIENDGNGQQFIGIYSDVTPSVDIIEEVSVPPGTFMVTQIKLNVTGSNGDVMVMHDDSSPVTLEKEGNEFTYDGRVEVVDAESFLKSLKFGIDSDEPTGPVTLELIITGSIGSIAGSEGTATTETAIRTINEINDPVELGPVAETVIVLARDLVGSGLIVTTGTTVNDGGDGNGVLFGINPATFTLPTTNSNVMGTLTFSGSLVGENFTLNGSSDVELAVANVMTTLTFSDGRGSTATRAITIRIVTDDSPPALPDNRNIVAKPGATQVTLGFYSAYDAYDTADGVEYTRAVNYEFTFMRLGGKQPSMQGVTKSAAELGLMNTTTETFTSTPTALPIEVLLTRNDVVLIPGDAYRVEISVIGTAVARNVSNESYISKTFTMETDGAYDELLVDLDPSADCGTGTDSDNDGVARAYELHIGTDCKGSVDDYIGSEAPVAVATITVPLSPPDVQVVAAGASTYTQIDTGVKCEGADCNNLKAFIVSSGLGGDADANAVAMVTGICPDPDDVSSVPNLHSCWVDDVSVSEDGNVGTIPLPLGYNLIDWVAADNNGNLVLSTSRTQLIYVAPTIVLDGITDLVLNGVAGTTEEGRFRARFIPQDGDQDGDPLSGNSISFIDGTVRTVDADNFRCEPEPSASGIDVRDFSIVSGSRLEESLEDLGVDNPQLVTSGAGIYTYTAGVISSSATTTVCRLDELSTTSITFGDALSLEPFYVAGNEINVSVAEPGTVAIDRIDEIRVTDPSQSYITVAAVAPGRMYEYIVTASDNVSVVVTIVPSLPDMPQEISNSLGFTGSFDVPIPTTSSQYYIDITASIGEVTHTVLYPIVDDPNSPLLGPDSDNDGVPDIVDSVTGPSHDGGSILLSERSDTDSDMGAKIEVPFGYHVSLGNNARVGRNGRNGGNQAQLDLDGIGPGKLVVGGIGTPPGYGNEDGDEGVFEFTVNLPANTNTAFISIPLLKGLTEAKGYGKYMERVLLWDPFDTDGRKDLGGPVVYDDTYYSAPGGIDSNGNITCPPPVFVESVWEEGLLANNQCVLLVITDGGYNDSDGQVNGIIVDPGAPAGGDSSGRDSSDRDNATRFGPRCLGSGCVADSNPNQPPGTGPTPPGVVGGGGGGGGATDLWFLLMLLGLIAVPVLRRQRKRLTR